MTSPALPTNVTSRTTTVPGPVFPTTNGFVTSIRARPQTIAPTYTTWATATRVDFVPATTTSVGLAGSSSSGATMAGLRAATTNAPADNVTAVVQATPQTTARLTIAPVADTVAARLDLATTVDATDTSTGVTMANPLTTATRPDLVTATATTVHPTDTSTSATVTNPLAIAGLTIATSAIRANVSMPASTMDTIAVHASPQATAAASTAVQAAPQPTAGLATGASAVRVTGTAARASP